MNDTEVKRMSDLTGLSEATVDVLIEHNIANDGGMAKLIDWLVTDPEAFQSLKLLKKNGLLKVAYLAEGIKSIARIIDFVDSIYGTGEADNDNTD